MSRQAFFLLAHSPQGIRKNLVELLENRLIKPHEADQVISYMLLAKGKEELRKKCPGRFDHLPRSDSSSFSKRRDRMIARGDSAALMNLAGYATHPDDKPALPVLGEPLSSGEVEDLDLYRNRTVALASYGSTGDIHYTRHTTPVNCYYGSLELHRAAEAIKGSPVPDIGFSRICGYLLTPGIQFRVYYNLSGHAPELRHTGESRMLQYSEYFFPSFRPDNLTGIILIGDSKYQTAMMVMQHSIDSPKSKNEYIRVKSERFLNAYNTGIPLFYIPFSKEGTLLLSCMQFPGWQQELCAYAAAELFARPSAYSDTGPFFSDCGDGNAFMGVDLNLYRLTLLLERLRSLEQRLAVVCLESQEEFYHEIFLRYAPGVHVRYHAIPTGFLRTFRTSMAKYYVGGDYLLNGF